MTAEVAALRAGDRFRVDGAVYQVLRVQPDSSDPEMLYVTTALDEPPMWISVDDIEELLI